MQSLLLSASERTAIVHTVQIPLPGPFEIQVKVTAVALNPVDALYTANPIGETGRTVGSDFAGVVSAIGAKVTDVKLDQRVAGFLQGACSVNDRPGAFAEYLVIPHDLVWHVPNYTSLTDAAAVSLCALTSAQAVYERLGLPAPFPLDGEGENEMSNPTLSQRTGQEPLRIFIYGASTSVGLYAAQFVRRAIKASDVLLYGAASRKHHDMLLDSPYSYTGLVDYTHDDWPAQIRNLNHGKGVDLAFDCISEGDSVARVASTMDNNGKLAIIRSRAGEAWQADERQLSSEPLYGAVWVGLGETVEYNGSVIPASPKARQFAVEFYKYLSETPLLPNPIRIMPGGLARIVQDGFVLLGPGVMGQRTTNRTEDYMRPIRGEKLVYVINK